MKGWRVKKGDEAVEVHRLGQAVVRAKLERDRRGVGGAAQADDRNRRQRGIPPLLRAKLQGVHPRKHQVEHDEIGLIAPRRRQGLRPVFGRCHAKTFSPKGRDHQRENVRIVLYNQD